MSIKHTVPYTYTVDVDPREIGIFSILLSKDNITFMYDVEKDNSKWTSSSSTNLKTITLPMPLYGRLVMSVFWWTEKSGSF